MPWFHPIGRLRQVAFYLSPRVTVSDRAWVARCLSPAQVALFEAMGLADQAHAVRVARRLATLSAPPHVLEAALLHDCAKPPGYGLFWRTLGVLAAPWLHTMPAEPVRQGWSRYLQVYRWHDAYGLKLAAEAGTSEAALALLAAYTDPDSTEAPAWLEPLKACDDLG